ncbi:MAG: hypothetical protein FJX46_02070 [Alphaproteobacteria bacterium]|nr:hypothetical protein [Alphaproteobacteria bacterium]
MSPRAECWILSDGKAGHENQSRALALAVGLPTEIKRLEVRWPWRWLPPWLWFDPLNALAIGGDDLVAPWPRLMIGCGRLTMAPLAALRALSGAFTVAIQHPRLDPARFDLVVAPRHDRLAGPNVVVTRGALSRVNPGLLASLPKDPRLADLPRPIVAVLIGGASRAYRFGAARARDLAERLARLAATQRVSLAVTFSRRTGEDNARLIAERLAETPAFIWDGSGDNPYLGMLKAAEAIVVTGDSVAMLSDAAAAGKPVYIYDLDGGSRKFSDFHHGLYRDGVARRFEAHTEPFTVAPIDEAAMVAEAVRRRLGLSP